MLHFGFNMPFVYMALYGSIMILAVLLLRALLKNRLPEFVFPVLWCVVLLRLLVPYSVSSPLSLPVPSASFLSWFAPEGFAAPDISSYQEESSFQQEEALAGSSLENGTAKDSTGDRERLPADGSARQSIPNEANISTIHEDAYVTEGQGTAADGTWLFRYRNLEAKIFLIRRGLPALYVLGLAAAVLALGWQKYRYGKKLRGSLLIEHNETVNSMLRELGMGHVLVFTNDEIASPLVCGLRSPRIYLPTGMDFQNTLLLRHILAHEAMHIRRHDNWLKAVMAAALCLHWYNPLVWAMSKCLASDLERACDAGVLKSCDEDGRKSYAYSLLSIAVTGGRSALFYSAFSKTEVEKRVKGILHYKKATALTLAAAVLFLFGSTVAFASGGQAPFSSYLTSYCASSGSRWGVRAQLSRDIALGENARKRAEDAVFSVLKADATGDPDILEQEIKAALGEEFGVERGAFLVALSLCLDQEEKEAEYAPWGLTCGEDGFWLYQGKAIRFFEDKMPGVYQSREEGEYDVSVQRDRLGNVISLSAWQPGDPEYDVHTRKIDGNKSRGYGAEDMEWEASSGQTWEN